MITYRTAHPSEYQAYLSFANMVFGTSTHQDHFDFAALIPKAYAPDADTASIHCLAVDDELGIRGLVAALTCDLHVLGATLHTGYIGTVSVHPDARGEGHMKRLMAMQLDRMLQNGCDVAFLGGRRQRYEYFGYVPGGIRWRMEITRANLRHALKDVHTENITFTEVLPNTTYEQAAAALHERLNVRFDRTAPGFATICQSYDSHLYACRIGSDMIGYIVANMNPSTIYEFIAIDHTATDQVLKAWMEQHDLSDMTIELPDWRKNELRHLSTWVESISMCSSEQIRILHYQPVIEAMLKLKATYMRLDDGCLGFDAEGQVFTVTVKNNQVKVTSGAATPIHLDCLTAGRLFTSPYPMEKVPDTAKNWFPLPFYISEPDKF